MVVAKFLKPAGCYLSLSCLCCWQGQVLAAGPADWLDRPWYLGVSVGDSHLQPELIPLQNALTLQGATFSDVNFDSHDTGYKVYLGTVLSKHLALEAGYFNLGEVGFSAQTQLPAASSADPIAGRLKSQGPLLDLLAMLPLTESWSLSARLGLAYHNVRAPLFYPAALNLTDFSRQKDFLEYKFGGGVHYQLTPAWSMRLELEHYRLDDLWGQQGDFKLFSLGVAYHYGSQQSDYQVSAAPEPVTVRTEPPAPVAPPPAPVAAPPVKALQLELADVHFEFDQSSLTETAKSILQQHIAVLKSQPELPLQIIGYTSASGSEQYNQQLSKRRANAVQQYLQSAGISDSRLITIGYGEQSPVSVEVNPADRHSAAAKANMRVSFRFLLQ